MSTTARMSTYYRLWRHRTSGEIYAVAITGGRVLEANGPINRRETRDEAISAIAHSGDIETRDWVQEHAEEFDLYTIWV